MTMTKDSSHRVLIECGQTRQTQVCLHKLILVSDAPARTWWRRLRIVLLTKNCNMAGLQTTFLSIAYGIFENFSNDRVSL